MESSPQESPSPSSSTSARQRSRSTEQSAATPSGPTAFGIRCITSESALQTCRHGGGGGGGGDGGPGGRGNGGDILGDGCGGARGVGAERSSLEQRLAGVLDDISAQRRKRPKAVRGDGFGGRDDAGGDAGGGGAGVEDGDGSGAVAIARSGPSFSPGQDFSTLPRILVAGFQPTPSLSAAATRPAQSLWSAAAAVSTQLQSATHLATVSAADAAASLAGTEGSGGSGVSSEHPRLLDKRLVAQDAAANLGPASSIGGERATLDAPGAVGSGTLDQHDCSNLGQAGAAALMQKLEKSLDSTAWDMLRQQQQQQQRLRQQKQHRQQQQEQQELVLICPPASSFATPVAGAMAAAAASGAAAGAALVDVGGAPGLFNKREAADGTFTPARMPRKSVELTPKTMSIFLPALRLVSGHEMARMLRTLSSAIDGQDWAAAKRLEREVRYASSPGGPAVQRLGHYFLRGIKLKVAALHITGVNERLSDPILQHARAFQDQKEAVASLSRYNAMVPFVSLTLSASFSAVLEAVGASPCIHLILNGSSMRHHWVSLLDMLATRPSGAPSSLRVTLIDFRFSLSHRFAALQADAGKGVGKSLAAAADRLGISSFTFSYHEIGFDNLSDLERIRGRCPQTFHRPVSRQSATTSASMQGESNRTNEHRLWPAEVQNRSIPCQAQAQIHESSSLLTGHAPPLSATTLSQHGHLQNANGSLTSDTHMDRGSGLEPPPAKALHHQDIDAQTTTSTGQDLTGLNVSLPQPHARTGLEQSMDLAYMDYRRSMTDSLMMHDQQQQQQQQEHQQQPQQQQGPQQQPQQEHQQQSMDLAYMDYRRSMTEILMMHDHHQQQQEHQPQPQQQQRPQQQPQQEHQQQLQDQDACLDPNQHHHSSHFMLDTFRDLWSDETQDAADGGVYTESLAVCSMMRLHAAPNDRRLQPRPREFFLQWVRSLHPDVFAVAEPSISQGDGSPSMRLEGSLKHFQSKFDFHDKVAEGKSGMRDVIALENTFQSHFLSSCIADSWNHPAQQLIHSCSTAEWREELQSHGFVAKPLSASTMQFLESFIRAFPSDLMVRESRGTVEICWMGNPMFSTSTWVAS